MRRGGFPLPSHALAKQGQPSQLLPKSRRTDDVHKEIDGAVEQTEAYVATVGGQEDVGIAPCEPELMDEDPRETQGNVGRGSDDEHAVDRYQHCHQASLFLGVGAC